MPAPADDGITPHATGAPRRIPTWPGETAVNEHEFWHPIPDELPEGLPPEHRDLLVAYPDAPPARSVHPFLTALAVASAVNRSTCRILAVSLAKSLAEADLEAVVAQNLRLFAEVTS